MKNMKEIKRSKKAVSAKVFYWIFVLLILLPLMIFSISKIISGFSYEVTRTKNIENLVLEDRIMNLLAFVDSNTGRVYKGIIFLPNFNESFLDYTLKTKRHFGVKLSLNDMPPIYFNSEIYSIGKPLINTNEYQETNNERYVLVMDEEGNLRPSFFNMSIIHEREYG